MNISRSVYAWQKGGPAYRTASGPPRYPTYSAGLAPPPRAMAQANSRASDLAPASLVGCTRGHAPGGGLLRPAASIGAPAPLRRRGGGTAPRGLILGRIGLIGLVVDLVNLRGLVLIVEIVSLSGLVVELVGLTGLIGVAVALAGPVDGDGLCLLLVAAVPGFLIDVGLHLPLPTAQQRASQLLLRAQQALSRLEHRIAEGGHGVLELTFIAR